MDILKNHQELKNLIEKFSDDEKLNSRIYVRLLSGYRLDSMPSHGHYEYLTMPYSPRPIYAVRITSIEILKIVSIDDIKTIYGCGEKCISVIKKMKLEIGGNVEGCSEDSEDDIVSKKKIRYDYLKKQLKKLEDEYGFE